ncbi:hypothetical protein NLJ89_g3647 [Agrocybe chaxingu]|uniref:F-box domain-containing protein n=1 Tax=Agrocybe chaxingu TaxID=84603 RepID=A0A9W8K4B7_9AGAR|nr:hypothetical protein NLJ89_g3647 [Agrocybe chaxingu]
MAANNDDYEFDLNEVTPTPTPVSTSSSYYHPFLSPYFPSALYTLPGTPVDGIDPELAAAYARLPRLSLEVIDKIVSYVNVPDARKFSHLSKQLVLIGRKRMLRDVAIHYRHKYGERSISEKLLEMLKLDARYATYIRHFEVYDLTRDLRGLIEAAQGGSLWGDEEFEDTAATVVLKKQHEVSPGWMFHDGALAEILPLLNNVQAIVLQFRGYSFDVELYNQQYPGALEHLLSIPTIQSFKIRGMANFPLSQLQRMHYLHTFSVWSCSFSGSEDSVFCGPESKALLENCNVANVNDPEGCFLRYLQDRRCTLDFSCLQNLVVDIRSAHDIPIVGYIMDAAADALDHFQLSTKYIYARPEESAIPSAGIPFTPLNLSNLKFVRSLYLRLNFRPKLGIDEIEWFLRSMEALPCGNHLEELELILDMAHDSDGSDRQDLKEYEQWPHWEDIFLAQNLSGITYFKIVISSAYQECFYYNYEDAWPGACIKLPRLRAKEGLELVLDEIWDMTLKQPRVVPAGSFQL